MNKRKDHLLSSTKNLLSSYQNILMIPPKPTIRCTITSSNFISHDMSDCLISSIITKDLLASSDFVGSSDYANKMTNLFRGSSVISSLAWKSFEKTVELFTPGRRSKGETRKRDQRYANTSSCGLFIMSRYTYSVMLFLLN